MITRREELIAEQDDDGEDESDGDDEGVDSGSESLVECGDQDDQLIDEGYEGYHDGFCRSQDTPRRLSPYRPLHRLRIEGHPTMKLSPTDKKWFKQHVKSFKWN